MAPAEQVRLGISVVCDGLISEIKKIYEWAAT
jgi:hypothetical protein